MPDQLDSDLRKLFRRLKAASCTWERCKKGYLIYGPDEKAIGTIHRSPGRCPHALKNLLSDMAKAGVDIR